MRDAGRKMDALVAEKVMGMGSQWTVHQQPDGTFVPTGEVWPYCPYFSSSALDMWLVIDELARRGYWCQMRTPFEAGPDGDGYWAGFTPHSTTGWNGTPDHWTQAETMPLAVCLAALDALGVPS